MIFRFVGQIVRKCLSISSPQSQKTTSNEEWTGTEIGASSDAAASEARGASSAAVNGQMKDFVKLCLPTKLVNS